MTRKVVVAYWTAPQRPLGAEPELRLDGEDGEDGEGAADEVMSRVAPVGVAAAVVEVVRPEMVRRMSLPTVPRERSSATGIYGFAT